MSTSHLPIKDYSPVEGFGSLPSVWGVEQLTREECCNVRTDSRTR